MHYGDKAQEAQNRLVIVVYKHGTYVPNVFEYMVESIHKCTYFNPATLTKIIRKPNKYFKKSLKYHTPEEWYKITLTETNFDVVIISDIENVSKSSNEFDRLH